MIHCPICQSILVNEDNRLYCSFSPSCDYIRFKEDVMGHNYRDNHTNYFIEYSWHDKEKSMTIWVSYLDHSREILSWDFPCVSLSDFVELAKSDRIKKLLVFI